MTVSYPDQKHEMISATVDEIIAVTPDIRILRLVPQNPLTYRAGQYLNISFGGLPPRTYSIANAPARFIEIHVKRGTGSASRYITDELKTGEHAALFTPAGESFYNVGPDTPILGLAGGLGIAPIKAIIEQALASGHRADIALCWATADRESQYLGDYFAALANRHSYFKYTALTGMLITDYIRGLDLPQPAPHIYMSGPPAMIAALLPVLMEKGVPQHKIAYDRHPEPDTLKR